MAFYPRMLEIADEIQAEQDLFIETIECSEHYSAQEINNAYQRFNTSISLFVKEIANLTANSVDTMYRSFAPSKSNEIWFALDGDFNVADYFRDIGTYGHGIKIMFVKKKVLWGYSYEN